MSEVTVGRDYLCNDYSSEGEGATQPCRRVAEAVHLALFHGVRCPRLKPVNFVGFRIVASVTEVVGHSQSFIAIQHSDDVSCFDGDSPAFWHGESVKVRGVHSEAHLVLSNELVPAKPCVEHVWEQNGYRAIIRAKM